MVSIPSVGVVMNWRNEKNKSGLYPVHIRIKQNNFARYYRVPTPIKIRIDQWTGKEGAWIKSNHPFAFEINNKIVETKGLINEYIKRTVNFSKPVTIEGIIYRARPNSIWLLVVNFNFSFSIGFSCMAGSYKIPDMR